MDIYQITAVIVALLNAAVLIWVVTKILRIRSCLRLLSEDTFALKIDADQRIPQVMAEHNRRFG